MDKKKPRIPHSLTRRTLAHDIRSKYAMRSPYDLCVIFLCLFALNVGKGMGLESKAKEKKKENKRGEFVKIKQIEPYT